MPARWSSTRRATPEEIARAAGVIRMSARAAQEELREVIGVLRDDDADAARATAATHAASMCPRWWPSRRQAGMDVAYRLEVDDADGARSRSGGPSTG